MLTITASLVAGGIGGGEVDNELRDLGIHQINSCNTVIAALKPRQIRQTLFQRPEHVLIITTVILPLRKVTGALDLVLDALGQQVSLIFLPALLVASNFSFLLSIHSDTINMTLCLNRFVLTSVYILLIM